MTAPNETQAQALARRIADGTLKVTPLSDAFHVVSNGVPIRRQGVLDLFDDLPLTLDDDPEIRLGDLSVVPAVERHSPPPAR
jgi:hypothetical protein